MTQRVDGVGVSRPVSLGHYRANGNCQREQSGYEKDPDSADPWTGFTSWWLRLLTEVAYDGSELANNGVLGQTLIIDTA